MHPVFQTFGEVPHDWSLSCLTWSTDGTNILYKHGPQGNEKDLSGYASSREPAVLHTDTKRSKRL